MTETEMQRMRAALEDVAKVKVALDEGKLALPKRRALTPTAPKRVRSLTGGVPGRKSLFRNKIRNPVSITLTDYHHNKVNKAKVRLGLTRADVIGLLIDRYADSVTIAG
jgi:hypothetical protein